MSGRATPAPDRLADLVAALAARVREAASAGAPLSKATAITMLRGAGVPRGSARTLIADQADGRWVLRRGETTRRGGRPTLVLSPPDEGGSEVLAVAKTCPDRRPKPVDLRTRLLRVARAAGFPKVEIRVQVVVLAGEPWWQRFAALAEVSDIVCALRALGVEPDAGCENSHPARRGWRRERCV